jgi:putative acetyltransferase
MMKGPERSGPFALEGTSLKQLADISIERVLAPTAEVIALLDGLNAALGPYTAEQRHALPVNRLFQPNIRFFIARLDGEAVACGGVGFYDGFAELKRMYSKPSIRGRGIAKKLLARLEMEARNAGQASVCIETGIYQREAMRFYEGAGYCRCEAFGPYAAMPRTAIETSLFYEKRLPNLLENMGGRVDR